MFWPRDAVVLAAKIPARGYTNSLSALLDCYFFPPSLGVVGGGWFGLSQDTLSDGLAELQDFGLLSMRKLSKKAPGLRHDYAIAHRYALTGPFRRGLPKAESQEAAASG